MLIFLDDERIRRMHRPLCVVHDAVERPGEREPDPEGSSRAPRRP